MTKKQTKRQQKHAERYAQLPEAFLKYLQRSLPGFRRQTRKVQIAFLQMILQAPTKYREHAGQEGWATFQATELERKFGRRGFDRINSELRIFDVYEEQPGRPLWSKVLGLTKAYQLTDKVTDLRDTFLAGVTRRQTNLLTEDRDVLHKPPVQAVEAKRKGGQTRAGWKVRVRTDVPVSQSTLKDLMVRIEGQIYAQEHGFGRTLLHGDVELKYLQELLAEARLIYMLSRNRTKPGHVVHRYRQSESGRLYARDVNLQNAYRLVRQAALHGYYDYDIDNCHFSILEQMAARYGHECPAIAYYRENKGSVRRELADYLGLADTKKIKTALIALVYGAAFSEDEKKAIPEILASLPLALRLYQHELFGALKAEVARARTAILAAHPRIRQTIRNDSGLTMDVRTHDDLQLLAHLLQGVEGKALETAHRMHPSSIVLLQHDGFTATMPLDHAAIEREIEAATGYRLTIEPTALSPRLEDAFAEHPIKNQNADSGKPEQGQALTLRMDRPYAG